MDEEGGHKRLLLAASCLGFLVSIPRATSANTALLEIRADLGAGLRWVLDGYTLVFAGASLTVGAISDRTSTAGVPGEARPFRGGLGAVGGGAFTFGPDLLSGAARPGAG